MAETATHAGIILGHQESHHPHRVLQDTQDRRVYFHDRGDVTHPNKNLFSPVQATNQTHPHKGSNQTAKNSEEDYKIKHSNKYMTTCLLHGLGHDMNL